MRCMKIKGCTPKTMLVKVEKRRRTQKNLGKDSKERRRNTSTSEERRKKRTGARTNQRKAKRQFRKREEQKDSPSLTRLAAAEQYRIGITELPPLESSLYKKEHGAGEFLW
jgi:hypothetical protein